MRINNLHAINQYHKWAEEQKVNRGVHLTHADKMVQKFSNSQKATTPSGKLIRR